MGRAICRCGQQLRTSAKSGSQIQCPRCEAWLTVVEKVLYPNRVLEQKRLDQEPDLLLHRTHFDEATQTAPESNQPNQSVANRRTRSATSSWVLFAFVLLVATLGAVLWAYWGLGGSDKKVASVDNSVAFKATDSKQLDWGQIDWQDHLEANPNGKQVEQVASKIAETGRLLDPVRFWEQLDLTGFEKKVLSPGGSFLAYQEKIPVKQIVDGMKTFPVEALSKPNAIASSKWDLMGFYQGPESIGVLVRYFHEPLDLSKLAMSESWISGLSQMLSVNEYFNVAKDLCARRGTSGINQNFFEKKQGLQDPTVESIFTPYFGYMVLIFDSSRDGFQWIDAVAIPSEVRLSRACGIILQKDWYAFRKKTTIEPEQTPSGWGIEGVIDVFGEYESRDEQSLGSDLLFGETRPDGEAVARIDRSIPGISPSRSRDLVSVALSATSNYGLLKARVADYRKNYPKDTGLDSLLISLWLRHHSSGRTGMTFDDFGSVFVDAADRLYQRYKDPVLVDIKARIFWSHGLVQDSDDQLVISERLGNTSAFFFQRQIEGAIERNDKAATLSYLTKFNTFWLGQPGVAIELDPNSTWKNLQRNWKN